MGDLPQYFKLVRWMLTSSLLIILKYKPSSLHTVFSLCARVGWCDIWTDFTNSVDVDLNEMPLSYI